MSAPKTPEPTDKKAIANPNIISLVDKHFFACIRNASRFANAVTNDIAVPTAGPPRNRENEDASSLYTLGCIHTETINDTVKDTTPIMIITNRLKYTTFGFSL